MGSLTYLWYIDHWIQIDIECPEMLKFRLLIKVEMLSKQKETKKKKKKKKKTENIKIYVFRDV